MYDLYILQLSAGHRTVILSAMQKIIKHKIDEIDNELTLDTIKQASAELTMSKVTRQSLTFMCHKYISKLCVHTAILTAKTVTELLW